jgi:hypothetical protein
MSGIDHLAGDDIQGEHTSTGTPSQEKVPILTPKFARLDTFCPRSNPEFVRRSELGSKCCFGVQPSTLGNIARMTLSGPFFTSSSGRADELLVR